MKRFLDYIKKYWWFYTNTEVRLSHEEKGYWGTERLKIFGWNGALTEFITRLSTVEGK